MLKHKHQENINKKFNKLLVLSYTKKGKYYYYNCICDCEVFTYGTSYSILKGAKKSCGCFYIESRSQEKTKPRSDIKPDGGSAFNYVFLTYKRNARLRNYEFNLNKEEFYNILIKPCRFCGTTKSNSYKYCGKKNSGIFYYTGIDRLNNNIGYILENCVPCCKDCNVSKMTKTESDFLNWIKKVYLFNFKE